MIAYDVAVVGGSVAGLQAALTIARARLRVVLFDDGHPRNRTAAHVHNYLGVGSPSPAELLAAGRQQLEQYGVEVRTARVSEISDDFVVDPVEGPSVQARAIVLATGLRDELPDVPGVAEAWGRLVVACPHCHGWEVRDQPLVQLGMRGLPDRSVERALLLSRWSDEVVLCTDGDELSDEQLARLHTAGVRVRGEKVEAVVNGRVVLEGGDVLLPAAVFVVVRQHQQSDLAARLGCQVDDGAVVVDSNGRTTVPGVYAVGTTAVPSLFAIGAAGHASTTAVALHADLLERDLKS
ncbi:MULTISPECIES: NAD(P)/FAD-dependent oxidoreductase [unclassified Kribbella]|uniref:NAD(P)/FAD-dependent oxidoreductase n=1 Tax=unclassified Kribbella TaxID=2644121 RepID=UPI0033F5CF65